MNTANETSNAWVERLTTAIRADARKSVALTVLVVVLAVMLGRAVMKGGTQPSRAAGAVPSSVTSIAGSSSDLAAATTGNTDDSSQYVDRMNGVDGANPSAIDAVRAGRTHNAALRLREWMTEPVKPLPRNLFAVRLDYFPRDGSRAKQDVKTAGDGEFWGRLEKSLMLQADQRDKRENLLANYRAEAGNLRLDSIIMGPSPKAMIDGKLLAEGEVVASFRVLKIEPRRIIVEREGIRLEILMK